MYEESRSRWMAMALLRAPRLVVRTHEAVQPYDGINRTMSQGNHLEHVETWEAGRRRSDRILFRWDSTYDLCVSALQDRFPSCKVPRRTKHEAGSEYADAGFVRTQTHRRSTNPYAPLRRQEPRSHCDSHQSGSALAPVHPVAVHARCTEWL